MADELQITQLRSANGSDRAQRETLRTLGLRGIGTTSRRQDGPAMRGLVRRVAHLVSTEPAAKASARQSARSDA
jgi:large subunit ribosomal protein L30